MLSGLRVEGNQYKSDSVGAAAGLPREHHPLLLISFGFSGLKPMCTKHEHEEQNITWSFREGEW